MRVALAAALLASLGVVAAAPASTAPRTALTITYWAQGEGAAKTWTLRCGPLGGTHPHRAAACRKLAATPAPFRPIPKDAVCTMQYGGPQVALVRGTHRGSRVWTYFRFRDGCEIERWKRVVPLLPSPDA